MVRSLLKQAKRTALNRILNAFPLVNLSQSYSNTLPQKGSSSTQLLGKVLLVLSCLQFGCTHKPVNPVAHWYVRACVNLSLEQLNGICRPTRGRPNQRPSHASIWGQTTLFWVHVRNLIVIKPLSFHFCFDIQQVCLALLVALLHFTSGGKKYQEFVSINANLPSNREFKWLADSKEREERFISIFLNKSHSPHLTPCHSQCSRNVEMLRWGHLTARRLFFCYCSCQRTRMGLCSWVGPAPPRPGCRELLQPKPWHQGTWNRSHRHLWDFGESSKTLPQHHILPQTSCFLSITNTHPAQD